jgi:hypothetical protein
VLVLPLLLLLLLLVLQVFLWLLRARCSRARCCWGRWWHLRKRQWLQQQMAQTLC